MRKPRLVVVDDHSGFLKLLISLLEIEFDVVGTAVDGDSGLEQIYRQKPDLVVLDLGMRFNGIEVTRKLVKNRPGLPVVICGIESDPEIIEAAQRAGALGYVFKLRIHKDLIPAVKSVIQGKPFVSSCSGKRFLRRLGLCRRSRNCNSRLRPHAGLLPLGRCGCI